MTVSRKHPALGWHLSCLTLVPFISVERARWRWQHYCLAVRLRVLSSSSAEEFLKPRMDVSFLYKCSCMYLGIWVFVFSPLITVNYIDFQKWKLNIPEKQWTWSQCAVYIMFLSGIRVDANTGLNNLWNVFLSIIWNSFK